MTFFATAPKQLEPLLADELRALECQEVEEMRAGVSFSGDLQTAYRVCLWSRLANRVLLPIGACAAESPEVLYQGIRTIDWSEHVDAEGTIAVDFTSTRSTIDHTHYGALKVKDAIVDQFRDATGCRPSIDLNTPDLRINVYVLDDKATITLDLSGGSLHRRGYRQEGVYAPLKENLAAAILVRANWPAIAKEGGTLFDPMCGSGTLILEAASMASDIAPGLLRQHFGFTHWLKHNPELWSPLISEANARREKGIANLPRLVGYDTDSRAVTAAIDNARRAGLEKVVHFERRALTSYEGLEGPGCERGLVITNPPYGERLGEVEELKPLYSDLGSKLKAHFTGWRAGVFTSEPTLAQSIRLKSFKRNVLYNGPIKCHLYQFEIDAARTLRPESSADAPLSEAGQMFRNRMRKNIKRIKKWANKSNVSCYRLYDRDLPEYAVAVDLYERHAHVQEYSPPKTVDAHKAERRLRDVMAALREVLQESFGIDASDIHLKTRKKQQGLRQYEKLDDQPVFQQIGEGGYHFLLNFTNYLDTGLFLDHRQTRALIGELAAGKHFLNLFGYTGTASVYAAGSGALSTTTIDMSNTYMSWARRNFELNNMSPRSNEIIRADCLKWIQDAPKRYDLIFLDPPTFSNSAKMEETFDVQRDHPALLRQVVELLSPNGIMIFSNNCRGFKMRHEDLEDMEIEEITAQTIPEDYARNKRIHNCWRIQKSKS